jgi:hypothetical protein
VGKHFNAELYGKLTPQPDDDFDEDGWNEPQYQRPTKDELEARYSEWLWDKQDAAPRSVRLWDECGVGR